MAILSTKCRIFTYVWCLDTSEELNNKTWLKRILKEGTRELLLLQKQWLSVEGRPLPHPHPHLHPHCSTAASIAISIYLWHFKSEWSSVLKCSALKSILILNARPHITSLECWGKSARQTWHTVFWSVSVFGNQRLLRERRVGPGLFFPVCLPYGQADHHGVLNQNDYPRCSTVENVALNDSIPRIKYHAIKSSFTEILIGLNINRIIIVSMYIHTQRAYSPIQALTH